MAIPLRSDFDAAALRAVARRTKDAAQARRLLALAAVYDGASRAEAANIGGVTLQIVRDWVLRVNAEGPDGLIDRKAPGQPSRLRDTHRAALAAAIESGPTPALHGVVRWRLVDLCQWLWEEFRVGVAKQTLSRELREEGGSAPRGEGCGPPAGPGGEKKKKPPAAGRSAAPDRPRRTTSARHRPPSSAPSAPRTARPRASFCPTATSAR